MKFSAIVPSATVVPLVDIQTGYTLMPRVCPKKNETIKEKKIHFSFFVTHFLPKNNKFFWTDRKTYTVFISKKLLYTISVSIHTM